jgi:hypothetical protein
VKKLIVAINGLLMLAALLVFTSTLTPTTASAGVPAQNDSKTMSGKHNRRHHRRHHKTWHKHHRTRHHGNKNT